MKAAALVAHLRGLGVALRADGDLLRYRPVAKVTPELRRQLLAAKADVLALLRVPGGPYVADPRVCAGCGRGGFTVMVATDLGDHFCRRCWADSTKIPAGRQPPTPTLDRLMARADADADADADAERERA